ncbi:hypothetical protein [Bradyrhizobium cajani]|uniref:Uncharacterized protein n=1 Tax=Bradyrhizobium cajani TaxID=1928661 RepID=A0A844T796_9BRAD|nr:hypothetical protein [Bradyrhizobium cajani]MCP3369696.1 hypothetical protein [Bradyrhizobium cajani]MVT74998.1 hypothetical protein [Bradyrhizobium cajani]
MTVLATSFDTYLALYDDFTRYANTVVMDGQSPIAGATWKTTGATAPRILDHYLIAGTNKDNRQLGYLYSIQPKPVSELGCDIVWSGGTQMVPAMTLTISADDAVLTLTRMLHFNFGPLGFNISFGDAVGPGAPLQPVTAGNWTVPMKNDGLTVYRVKMAVRGNSLVVFGPNGEVFGWSDARVSRFAGGLCFLEPGIFFEGDTAGLTAKVKRAWAVSDGSTDPASELGTLPTSPFAANNDFAALGNYFYYGRVVGALNKMGEVDVGLVSASPAVSFPQVQFGPTNIVTSLAAAAAIGDTTISTVDYIPNGTMSVTIDPGPNQEVVTIGPLGGQLAPYALSVPALGKAHAAGAIVQCAVPDSMRYTVIYDQINQRLRFQLDGAQIVSFGSHLYITTRVGPDSNPMLQLILDNSGTPGVITSYNGRVRMGQTNTFATGVGSPRPTLDLSVGDQFYDTSLGKPIWVASVDPNGTAHWTDAAGTPA